MGIRLPFFSPSQPVRPPAPRPPGFDEMARETVEERAHLAESIGKHGEIYAYKLLKRKLNGVARPAEAFAYFRSAASSFEAADLREQPIRGLAEFAKLHAAETILTFEGGLKFDLAPPIVYGEGNHAPVPARARTLLTACFADAAVSGRSSFIQLPGAAVLDFEAWELSSIDDHLDYDPAIFRFEDRRAWVIGNAARVPPLELEEAFMMTGVHSWEFGHWFLEFLPKYLLALQTGRLDGVPVLIDPGMPDQHKQALRLIAPRTVELINLHVGQTARVKRLWCATSPSYPPVDDQMNERFHWGLLAFYPPNYAALMDEMMRRLAPSLRGKDSPKRVFLARRPNYHRALKNSSEIEEIVTAHGFSVVYPQDLTFREQVEMIRDCDFIAGPEGSALFLAFLAKPLANIMILNHPLTFALALVTSIYEARGSNAAVVTGPIVAEHPDYPHQSDYVIDPEFFAQTFERWVRDGEAAMASPALWDAMAAATAQDRQNLASATGGLGELLWRQAIKTRTNALASVAQAFRYYTSVVAPHRLAALHLKPIIGLLDIAGRQALDRHNVMDGGGAFELNPPTVFGDGNQAPVHGRTRALFAACLEGARLRGRSSCIELSEALVFDFEEAEFSALDDHLEYDPALFWAEGRQGWVIDNTRAVPDLKLPAAFTLLGAHSWEFGHWFLEFMPKFILALQSGKLPNIPILIDAGMPPQHHEAIRLLAPPSMNIIEVAFGQSVLVDRLWCATSVGYSPIHEETNERFDWGTIAFYPPAFASLMDGMARRLAPAIGDAGGPRRVFMARKPGQHRVIQNAESIEAVAKSRGFEIVYPQDLTFTEQLRLALGADVIAGPEGSALFLAFLAKPGTRVLILNHPLTYALALVTSILEARGSRAEVFTGPITEPHPRYPHQSSYRIDPEAFAAHLDRWLTV